jgi:SAM-dependent methyltransferase
MISAIVGVAGKKLLRLLRFSTEPFKNSASYWEERYVRGGNSGVGSYGRLAKFKAEVLNAIVADHGISSVLEFGCGDGNQLQLAKYPSYIGFDVSETAVRMCRLRFKDDHTKRFALLNEYTGQKADLTLSIDVIYHLVEDDVYEAYMTRLFSAATQLVVAYSSNTTAPYTKGPSVRHREFTEWVKRSRADWELVRRIPNRYPYRPGDADADETSLADFFVFSKRETDDRNSANRR